MVTSAWPFSLPSFFSTVTPGQLPTYWLDPVSWLNSVVFPQFGLPASAIVIAIFHSPPYFVSTCTISASAFRTESS